MKQSDLHKVLQQKYSYNSSSPQFTSIDGKYKIFNGSQKEISLNVSLKILEGSSDPSLINYLNKLKSTKSDQVIRIYQIIEETNYLILATEQISYGTLANGLINCKKFDDYDAVYIGKYLLTGYADILRSGIQWYGSSNDIQITQTGIKFSWNNTTPISSQTSNTFKQLLQLISIQNIPENEPRLLPFPQSKLMKQIIKLSQSSASQISLAPMMKKKEKYIRKKFKAYLLIRQTKNSGEYFEQNFFLGVSKQNGFVRIKVFKKGVINPTILQLNKTKNTFTKVIEVIQEGNLVYIVSTYSNDGNLQNYVQRLKSAGIQLKEDQIQFFFYSMFQPLKAIQQSSIKSLSMSLHIKNIFIESGIPKIGQSIPMNEDIKQKLVERADVPDFYHPGFKRTPNVADPSFDTYSLGVLLYKLMFTEYPIFPNGKVHIPTTPTFSSRLKKTLQIFLNEGGKLADIQKRIQISENVLKQVKKNKEKLMNAKKIQEKKQKVEKKKYQKLKVLEDDEIQNKEKHEDDEKDKALTQNQDDQDEILDDCFDCFVKLQIADHTIDPQVQSLEESPYKTYRLCTKLLCFLLVYILIMYMFYLRDNISMLTKQSNLSKLNVTISTVKYEIITSDMNQFYLQFNQTSRVLSDLTNMGCSINNYGTSGDYSQFVYANSLKWLIYLIGGLVLFALIIFMKSLLIFKFDYIKAKYNYQHNISNFNYSNYLIFNLLLASLINQHFQFFNIIFYSTLPACLGNQSNKVYSNIFYMFNQNDKFMYVHLPIICGFTLICFIYFLVVFNTDHIKYSKILNPIILFAPFLMAYWVVVRVGVLSDYFYPSVLSNSQSIITDYFKLGDYIGIIGIIPESLFILEFIINKLIDLFYWMLIDKRRRVMIQENSTQNIQLFP